MRGARAGWEEVVESVKLGRRRTLESSSAPCDDARASEGLEGGWEGGVGPRRGVDSEEGWESRRGGRGRSTPSPSHAFASRMWLSFCRFRASEMQMLPVDLGEMVQREEEGGTNQ